MAVGRHDGLMIDIPRSWRFDRGGEWIFAGVSGDLSWFGRSRVRPQQAGTPHAAARHAGEQGWWTTHPSWQLVLGVEDALEVADAHAEVSRGAGLLVPPGKLCRMSAHGAVVHLWIDPPSVPGSFATDIIPLDRGSVESLVGAIDGGRPGVAERVTPQLADLLGSPTPIDPRLRAALDELGRSDSLHDLADRAGITPRRLRQLAAANLGGRLRDLRRWHRLREAGLNYPFLSATESATAAGFADQSHLIRTSRTLTSRTFADVARPVLAPGSTADMHRLHRK